MSYFITKNGKLITASSKRNAIKIIANAGDNFFELLKLLDENKVKYDKTTFSFDIEKGVVIKNSYLLKVIGDNYIYGTIYSTKETSDFDVVKKWLESLIKRIKPVEVKPKRTPLKDFIGEGKEIERIRRKLEKEFPRYVIKEMTYPIRVKSKDGKDSLIVDYKNNMYSITVIDKNGFIVKRPYRCTDFGTLLQSVYNHVYLSNLEEK